MFPCGAACSGGRVLNFGGLAHEAVIANTPGAMIEKTSKKHLENSVPTGDTKVEKLACSCIHACHSESEIQMNDSDLQCFLPKIDPDANIVNLSSPTLGRLFMSKCQRRSTNPAVAPENVTPLSLAKIGRERWRSKDVECPSPWRSDWVMISPWLMEFLYR